MAGHDHTARQEIVENGKLLGTWNGQLIARKIDPVVLRAAGGVSRRGAERDCHRRSHAIISCIGGKTTMSTTNKVILCGFGVDVDAVAGWLGSYGGQDSPFDISRGLFAGEVGTPRLLRLYDRYKIKTSWFIPGYLIETFPEQMREVAQAGHEIGAHGYSHENPISDDSAPGRRRAGAINRPGPETRRQEAARFCGAVVEDVAGYRSATAQTGFSLRP